jgi:tetratricopeptide (TPR) repeat protein
LRPVQRTVALKIIKPGMDTRQVIARFEAERQALAMMDHPNIAKVLDAGTTDGGRPYFVMDLVRGVAITDYCDQSNLSTRERLELFVTVCQAVQHAHQKGVIHRDIKPTNVLVTMQDGRPAPKIIDFGVAKATSQRLTERTPMTGFAQLIGTPLYMSPEQAELSPLGVDTRSDVYSLGVLLYELLTGTTPFDKDRLHAASFDELRRIIRDEQPARPSARISSFSHSGSPGVRETASHATTLAERRRGDSRRLVQTIRGDLDWIVMKCLDKDRNRRYESANDLAWDIRRYLDNEPVLASPPSWTTGLAKWARRHRGLVTAAGLLTVMIAVSSSAGAFFVAQEQAATRRALVESEQNERALQVTNEELEKERRRAEENLRQARAAVDRLFTRVAGDLTDVPHLTEMQRALLEDALEFYQQFLGQDQNDPTLRHETARAYQRVGNIQHALGRTIAAVEAFQQATALLEELVKEYPADRTFRHDLMLAYGAHSYTLLWTSDQQTIELRERQLSVARTIAEQNPSDPSTWEWVAASHTDVGGANVVAGHVARAEPHFREGLRVLEDLYDRHPELPKNRSSLSHCRLWFGNVLMMRRKYDEAEPLMRSAVAIRRELLAASPEQASLRLGLAHAAHKLALLCRLRGENGESLELQRESIGLYEKLFDDFPDVLEHRRQLGQAHYELARVLFVTGLTRDAEVAQRRATFHLDRLAEASPQTMVYQLNDAEFLFALGQTLAHGAHGTEAAAEFHRALAYYQAALERFSAQLRPHAELAAFLATCPAVQFRDAERAAQHARRALQLDPDLPDAWRSLGIALYYKKDWATANQAFEKSFELQTVRPDVEDYLYRAIIAWHREKPDEARRWYQTGLERWPTRPPHPPWVRQLRDEAAAILGLEPPSDADGGEPTKDNDRPIRESNSHTSLGGRETNANPQRHALSN